jgi:hypothetical protein
MFVFRNTILTTWQSAGVSEANSRVCPLLPCHRVAITFDADNDDAEEWLGTRQSDSSSTMFRCNWSECTSVSESAAALAWVPKEYIHHLADPYTSLIDTLLLPAGPIPCAFAELF